MKHWFLLLICVITFTTHANLPRGIVVDSHGHYWSVEIAETSAQQARGLMYRIWLPPSQGMLFIFNPAQHVSFWMKNTWIPLDMRFFSPDGSLNAHYPYALPCVVPDKNCTRYSSNDKTMWVLETAALNHLSQGNLKLILKITDN